MNEFSDQQSVDDISLPCQQANLFYCDMPQGIQDRANIIGIVNGKQTPTLPVSQTYKLLNCTAETIGELALQVRGEHVPLIPDIEELGGVARPEDLKVLVGSEEPEKAFAPTPRESRIEHAKRLLRTNGRIGAPLTKQSRIEEIEAMQNAGIADADQEAELYNIIREIEDQTGEYYFLPVPVDMVTIQMDGTPLPPGNYNIDSVSEDILDKIGDTIFGPFEENFDSIIDLLESGRDLVVSNLPAAILEAIGAMRTLDKIADQEMSDILRQGGRNNRVSGSFIGELRRNPAARIEFKRKFVGALLKQKVVSIKMFSTGHTVLAFEAKARIRTAYGRLTLRSKYRTSFLEASARISGGRVASVAGGAFKGLAAVGIGIVVYSEIRDFLDPETGGDWSDLFVGLGIEMAKTILSAIIGAGLTALLVAAGAIAGPVWLVILAGAGVAMLVGAVINVVDERLRIKDRLRSTVNAAQARTRDGQVVQWQ